MRLSRKSSTSWATRASGAAVRGSRAEATHPSRSTERRALLPTPLPPSGRLLTADATTCNQTVALSCRSVELLVLGGTHFVGRAVVEDALARGWPVTTLSRGGSPAPDGAEALVGDRTSPDGLAALSDRRSDVVVDTAAGRPPRSARAGDGGVDRCRGAPRIVRDSAAMLADAVGGSLYVSSRSVYA